VKMVRLTHAIGVSNQAIGIGEPASTQPVTRGFGAYFLDKRQLEWVFAFLMNPAR
jgi:hypothetical protein